MGKHQDAIQAFEKSLELQPHNADAHTNIANCQLMLKDVHSAVKHLEQATNFNPLDGEIQYNLGCVYEAIGEVDKATRRLQMASDAGITMATKKLKQMQAKHGSVAWSTWCRETQKIEIARARDRDSERQKSRFIFFTNEICILSMEDRRGFVRR